MGNSALPKNYVLEETSGNSILERSDIFFKCIGFLSYAYLAYTYYSLWAFPALNEGDLIFTYTILIALEFILIHSGVFMLVLSESKFALLFFFLFYGLFVLAINALTPDNTVMYTYMLVVFNRMRFAFYKQPSPELKKRMTAYSAGIVLLYFLLFFIFKLGSDLIPRLAFTKEYIAASGYHLPANISSLGFENFYVALAFGFTYFTIIALIELRSVFYRKGIKTE